MMSGFEIGKPYEGAKEHCILDISNPIFVRKIVSVLWDNLPFPKRKK